MVRVYEKAQYRNRMRGWAISSHSLFVATVTEVVGQCPNTLRGILFVISANQELLEQMHLQEIMNQMNTLVEVAITRSFAVGIRHIVKEIYEGLTHRGGEFSSTKFWASAAYAVASWIMCYLTLHSLMNAEYFLFYLGIVASHATASKFLTGKYKENKENVNDVSD